MSEPGSNRHILVIAALALLVPAVLGLGWLLGRIEGPRQATGSGSPATDLETKLAGVHAARYMVEHRGTPAAPEAEGAKPSELSNWTTYDAAVADSRKSGKPVLVDFNAAWCGPCQALKRTVFDDAARGPAVQAAVIPVSIVDRRREDGNNPDQVEDLQQQYDVNAFPTLIVFSPTTGRKEMQRGFSSPDEMLRWIQEAAQRVR